VVFLALFLAVVRHFTSSTLLAAVGGDRAAIAIKAVLMVPGAGVVVVRESIRLEPEVGANRIAPPSHQRVTHKMDGESAGQAVLFDFIGHTHWEVGGGTGGDSCQVGSGFSVGWVGWVGSVSEERLRGVSEEMLRQKKRPIKKGWLQGIIRQW
jgi:hypothetical protein